MSQLPLHDQLKKYEDDLFGACDKAIKEGQLQEPVPDIIFHLTDVDALSKIFSTRCLWASEATTLNDSLEIRHAIKVAAQAVEERLKNGKTEFLATLHQFLVDPSSIPKKGRYGFSDFVVAFCGRPRKSSQWLNYGRAGRGVALGFSPSIAKTAGYDLIKVDYEIESQKKRVGLLVDNGSSVFEAMAVNRGDRLQLAQVAAHFVLMHIRMALAAEMKHPSFSDEDEWRLLGREITYDGHALVAVNTQRRAIEFRTVGDRLIPYDKLDFTADRANLVKEVIIGHASPLSEDAVRLLARENGFNIVVSRSEVPVRPSGNSTQ